MRWYLAPLLPFGQALEGTAMKEKIKQVLGYPTLQACRWKQNIISSSSTKTHHVLNNFTINPDDAGTCLAYLITF